MEKEKKEKGRHPSSSAAFGSTLLPLLDSLSPSVGGKY